MATRTVSFHTLVCDGCGTQFGLDKHHPSVIEVRAVAFTAGWRFPPRRRASGGESVTVNDVCPECLPGWREQPAQDNWKNRRARS